MIGGEGIQPVTVEQLAADIHTQLTPLIGVLESTKAKIEANKQRIMIQEGGLALWDAVASETQRVTQLANLIEKLQQLDLAMQPDFETSDTPAFDHFFVKTGEALSQAYDIYRSKLEVADTVKKIAESFVMWAKKKRRGSEATSMLWYTKIIS